MLALWLAGVIVGAGMAAALANVYSSVAPTKGFLLIECHNSDGSNC